MYGMTFKSVFALAQVTEGSTAANTYKMHTILIDKNYSRDRLRNDP